MRRIKAMLALLATLMVASASAKVPLAYPFCVAYECGLIDTSGNWLAKPAYSKLVASGPYWVAERASGLVGLLDASGKELIPPSFREIGQFVDGLAPAKGTENDLYGYIDPAGKWVIEAQYFGAHPFADGIAEVIRNPDKSSHLLAEFIDSRGKTVIQKKFLVSGSSVSQANGLFLVEAAGNGGETRSALIDRRGNYVVPPRDDQYIQLGEDGSIVIRRGQSESLLDAQGKTLLQVRGEDAIIRSVGDGLAFFELPGKGVGLVNARSGRIIVPPQPNWVWIGEFSEGLASLRVLTGKDDVHDGYINREGKVVIAPRFSNVSPFRGGLAAVREISGPEGLIDVTGNWQRRPTGEQRFMPVPDEETVSAPHLRSVLMAYAGGSADSPAAFPSEEAARLRPAELPVSSEYLTKGQRLASIHRHPCGVEIAANARGERTWPENLVGRCATEQLSRVLNNDEEKLSPSARAAYLEEKKRIARQDAERNHEVHQRDKHTGSVSDMVTGRLYPAKMERDKRLALLIEEAGWRYGEADIPLHGSVHIRLPAGVKLLLPDKVAELQEKIRAERATPLPLPPGYLLLQEQFKAGTVSPEEFAKQDKQWRALFPDVFAAKPAGASENQKAAKGMVIPMAMLADENDRWQATLHIFDGGHLRLEKASLPAQEELLDTLRTYGFWRNTGGLGREVTGFSSYQWLSPPHLETSPRMLSWAFKYFDMYSGKPQGQGFQHGTHANILMPGRNSLVQISAEWSGPFSESLAETYFPEITALAKGIEFQPGQGYADVQAGDPHLNVPVARLITGAPPESLQRFSATLQTAMARDETERRKKITSLSFEAAMYLLAGGVVLFGAARRRRKADVAGQSFDDGEVHPSPSSRQH